MMLHHKKEHGCQISETQQQEMQEQAADGDDGGDGVSFKGWSQLPLVFYFDEIDQDRDNGG